MKVFAAIVLVLFMPALASAGVFLVCDPVDGATAYEVEVNGAAQAAIGTATTDGRVKLLEVTGLDPDAYDFRARALGTGGWPGPWSDPFQAQRPGGVSGLSFYEE